MIVSFDSDDCSEFLYQISLKRTLTGHGWHGSDCYSRIYEELPIHHAGEIPIFCKSVIISIIGVICLRLSPLRSGCGPSFSRLGQEVSTGLILSQTFPSVKRILVVEDGGLAVDCEQMKVDGAL